jgi:hypothetical protein
MSNENEQRGRELNRRNEINSVRFQTTAMGHLALRPVPILRLTNYLWGNQDFESG